MKKMDLMHQVHMAQSAVESVNKFLESIDEAETAKAFKTMKGSFSAELLSMMTILMVLQAMVSDKVITKDQYATMATRMVTGENSGMDACKVLMVIHMKRLQGEDYFDGKEI